MAGYRRLDIREAAACRGPFRTAPKLSGGESGELVSTYPRDFLRRGLETDHARQEKKAKSGKLALPPVGRQEVFVRLNRLFDIKDEEADALAAF